MKKKFKLDKHALIPKHVKISDAEKKKILEKYDITEAELPKILKTDAAIQAIDCKPGDVIKITRNSPTAKEAVFYRVVVNV